MKNRYKQINKVKIVCNLFVWWIHHRVNDFDENYNSFYVRKRCNERKIVTFHHFPCHSLPFNYAFFFSFIFHPPTKRRLGGHIFYRRLSIGKIMATLLTDSNNSRILKKYKVQLIKQITCLFSNHVHHDHGTAVTFLLFQFFRSIFVI